MTKREPESGDALGIVAAIAAAQLLLHALTNGNYGIFRDELYYLDCARHLGWGYVDQPPLSIWLLALTRSIFGESVHAIRLLSQLAGAVTVVVGALIARELGGGRLAQVVAALAVAVTPGTLILSGFFSMNAFDLLFWALLAWLLARIAHADDPSLWLWFGVVAGFALLNKTSVLFLGFGVAVAIVLTPLRRHLGSWQLWAGGAIAGLLFSPYVIWNASNNWPTLEFMSNARQYKIADISPLGFLGEQVLSMSPPLAPLWIGGLVWLLMLARGKAGPEGARASALGWVYVVVCAALILMKGKPYYLFVAYPMLFAAGAVAVERLFARWSSRRWASVLVVVWVAAAGAVTLPLSVPMLAPDGFLRYQSALGLAPKHYENNTAGAMPQYFADRFGWEEMAALVATVYDGLSDAEKADCVIMGSNYGEAGAINRYGPALGLPHAVSTHNSHFLWGLHNTRPQVLIRIGGSRERLEELFEEVEEAARTRTTYGMPYENNLPIYVARGPKGDLAEVWNRAKNYI
jgi:hypothetical protein